MLEVYLFDFKEEIYGEHMRVDFLHKFRNEEKYADLETLRQQIERDVADAREYFRTASRTAKAPRREESAK